MARMVTPLFVIFVAVLVDMCYCTGYIWQPFGQRPPDGSPPPPPQSMQTTPSPPPPEEKPGCAPKEEPKKKEEEAKKDDKKEGGSGTEGGPTSSEPIVGFPPSPFSGFPPSQKVPIPTAFYQGLKGGPLAGFQIQSVQSKGTMPVAVLADLGPTGPPVPPPSSYPALSKGGVLKGWRVAPLARPIVLQQTTVPSGPGKSKSFQAVSPNGAIVVQNTPSIWNVNSKGRLSYIAI